MLDYAIQPLVGVGAIRLGMSPNQVRQVMPLPVRAFRKTPSAKFETDDFGGLHVYYGGDVPIVEFIELSRGAGFTARYLDWDIFATPAAELVSNISPVAAFDSTCPDFPFSYIFPSLQISLWRPSLPADDPSGCYFSTVGVAREGYFGTAP